jgi:hypothetical protein
MTMDADVNACKAIYDRLKSEPDMRKILPDGATVEIVDVCGAGFIKWTSFWDGESQFGPNGLESQYVVYPEVYHPIQDMDPPTDKQRTACHESMALWHKEAIAHA